MSAVETSATKTMHDSREFWRVLLAVVVPIPWLAKGIQYIVLEANYDHSVDQIKAFTSDHLSSPPSSRWLWFLAGAHLG